jgi:hypothetical protein
VPDLEQDLTDLSAAIAWPPTPRLRIAPPREQRRPALPRWALAVAAALVIAAGVLIYTPTREAIANFLNLHTVVNRVPSLPTPSSRAGQSLGLGRPTTLRDAQSRLTWHVTIPQTLGQPDAVYLALPPEGPSGGEVTLVYTASPGIKPSGQTGVSLLVTEARGTVNEQFFGKTVGPNATIESVEVNGHKGWWISGEPHIFVFTDAKGNPYFDTLRLATNTLLLDDGGTVVRIEGDMTKAQALQIASSI